MLHERKFFYFSESVNDFSCQKKIQAANYSDGKLDLFLTLDSYKADKLESGSDKISRNFAFSPIFSYITVLKWRV